MEESDLELLAYSSDCFFDLELEQEHTTETGSFMMSISLKHTKRNQLVDGSS